MNSPNSPVSSMSFFGADSLNKRIILYPDRAGNKRREELEQITTDSRALKRELESYGFEVELMNEGQATVYHWQQFKLLLPYVWRPEQCLAGNFNRRKRVQEPL